MVAIKNWTLPILAMPPPAAGHDFPGKLNQGFLTRAWVDFQTKSMWLSSHLRTILAQNIQFEKLRHEQENGIFLDKRDFHFSLPEKLSDLV